MFCYEHGLIKNVNLLFITALSVSIDERSNLDIGLLENVMCKAWKRFYKYT